MELSLGLLIYSNYRNYQISGKWRPWHLKRWWAGQFLFLPLPHLAIK